MSDAIERSPSGADSGAPDADAWAKACAEDFAAEQARRRAEFGPEPVSAAEELRRLFDNLSDRVSAFRAPGSGGTSAVAQTAAQQFAKQFLATVKSAVEPVVERNPQLFDHLAAAGTEIAAAYRAAVERQETSWTRDDEPPSSPKQIDVD